MNTQLFVICIAEDHREFMNRYRKQLQQLMERSALSGEVRNTKGEWIRLVMENLVRPYLKDCDLGPAPLEGHTGLGVSAVQIHQTIPQDKRLYCDDKEELNWI